MSRDSLDCNRSFSGRKTQSHITADAVGDRGAFVRRQTDATGERGAFVRREPYDRLPCVTEKCRYTTAEGFGLFYLACPGAGQSPGLACSDTVSADTRHSGAVRYIISRFICALTGTRRTPRLLVASDR